MSSTASILQQKLKESVGVAQATVDEDLNICVERMNALERDVQVLKKVLETTVVTQNVQVVRARQQQVEVLLQLSNKIVRNSNSSTVEYYDNYKTVHDYMDGQLPAKLNEAFEKAVIQPLEGWLVSLTEVRNAINEAEKQRVVYDHYKDKTNSLLDSKRKTQLKGKIFDKASEEKLVRNQEKLATAETAYNEARDGAVGRILYTLENARAQLDMVLLRVMQYEKQVFQECLTCTKSYDSSIASLVGLHKDRKAAMSTASVDRVVQSIGYARQARENGSKLDIDTFLGMSTKQENSTIGRTSGRNSRSGSVEDTDTGNTTSMSTFLNGGNDDSSGGKKNKQSTSPAVLAARSALAKTSSGSGNNSSSSTAPKSPGNPFGSNDSDDHSSFTASLSSSASTTANSVAPPPLPTRRPTADPSSTNAIEKSSFSSSSSGGNASTKASPAATTKDTGKGSGSGGGGGGGMFSSFAKGILRGGNPFATTTKPDDEIEENDNTNSTDNDKGGKGDGDLDSSFTRELQAVDTQASDDPLPPVVTTHTTNASKPSATAKPPIAPVTKTVVPSAPDFGEMAHSNAGWDTMDSTPSFASPTSAAATVAAKSINKMTPSNPFGAPTGNDFDPFSNPSSSSSSVTTSSSSAPSNPFAASTDDFGFGSSGSSGFASTTSSTAHKGPSALPKPLSAPAPSNTASRTRPLPSVTTTTKMNGNANTNAFGFEDFGSGTGFDSFGTASSTGTVPTNTGNSGSNNSWDDFGFGQPTNTNASATKAVPKQPDYDPNDPFAGM